MHSNVTNAFHFIMIQLKNSIEQASSVAITTDGATMKNSGDSYVMARNGGHE